MLGIITTDTKCRTIEPNVFVKAPAGTTISFSMQDIYDNEISTFIGSKPVFIDITNIRILRTENIEDISYVLSLFKSFPQDEPVLIWEADNNKSYFFPYEVKHIKELSPNTSLHIRGILRGLVSDMLIEEQKPLYKCLRKDAIEVALLKYNYNLNRFLPIGFCRTYADIADMFLRDIGRC